MPESNEKLIHLPLVPLRDMVVFPSIMAPFVVGRDPWNREAMRRDAFTHGLWQFRAGTGNFAWAGIDMALWDLCGRACGQPLWRMLGGLQEPEPTYFYYLARGPRSGGIRASASVHCPRRWTGWPAHRRPVEAFVPATGPHHLACADYLAGAKPHVWWNGADLDG
jgi:L-alanine-DL-glutamate epimerase-like enolase superfamily enzyme